MVKKKKNDAVKAEYADILASSRKATSELLTAVEKSSVCFLHFSCAGNARKAWLSLKEWCKPLTVTEDLRLVNMFDAMKLRSARKNPVEIFCIPLELVRARLEELDIKIPDKYFVLQVLGNLTEEYDVQCQMMRIELSAQKLSIESMYK